MKTSKKGAIDTMIRIRYAELQNMDRNEEIMVSNIRLNARLSYLQRVDFDDDFEAISIISKSLGNRRTTKPLYSYSVFGVRMTVENAIKCFNGVSKIPICTFARVAK